jgi:hypothetical protein
MLDIVPVTTKRVLLPGNVNPLAAVRPVVVLSVNVVPDGGLTKLIEANNIAVELNPLKTNPLASCPLAEGKNDLESGADTLCPNPKNEISKKHITNNFFILFYY